jgi:plastocyanin
MAPPERPPAVLLAIGAAVIVGLALAAPAVANDKPPRKVETQPPAAVSGTVRLPGATAPLAKVVPDKDTSVCKPHFDPSLIVGTKGALANVIVWIDDAPALDRVATSAATLDQVGCQYVPRVQAITVGSKLTFRNSDATFHNVHAYVEPDGDTAFNLSTPKGASDSSRTVEETGLLSFKCDAGHSWMRAWVRVFDHPYFAVTGADGAFTISGLPTGTYTLRAWHEKLGERSIEVRVKRHKTSTVDVEFTR